MTYEEFVFCLLSRAKSMTYDELMDIRLENAFEFMQGEGLTGARDFLSRKVNDLKLRHVVGPLSCEETRGRNDFVPNDDLNLPTTVAVPQDDQTQVIRNPWQIIDDGDQRK